MTWHELVDHGIAVRGPGLEEREVWYDRAAVASWIRSNLVEYWEPWLRRYAAGPAAFDDDEDAMAWGVLGISRLHYTLTTLRITSKTGAGEHAREAFGPQWHPTVVEALRVIVIICGLAACRAEDANNPSTGSDDSGEDWRLWFARSSWP